jgi:hypothetical protein
MIGQWIYDWMDKNPEDYNNLDIQAFFFWKDSYEPIEDEL